MTNVSMSKQSEKDLIAAFEQGAEAAVQAHEGQKSNKATDPNLPEGTRQILVIKTYRMISDNWQDNDQNKNIFCSPHLELSGHPTPSSEVVRGYIRFVDPNGLKRPRYSKKTKTITIYMDFRAMPMILEQLKHSQRYLWVGHFSGGHYYGDMHTVP